MDKNRLLLPLNLLIGILAISTASIFIRFAQAEGVPSLVIAALRLSIATLMLTPVALTRYWSEIAQLSRKELVLGIVSGTFLALHFATWITSLEYTSVASSAVLVATSPLWVALLSPVLLKEKLTKTAIIGLVIAFLGGAVIGLSEACSFQNGFDCSQTGTILKGRALWGNLLAVAGAWAITGYLIIGRKLQTNMSFIPYIFMVYGMAAIILILIMLTAGHSPFGLETKAYGWIFLLAAVPQLIGHSTFNWALRHLPATLVAVTTLSEPIGSAVLAFILLQETPGNVVVTGGILILIGILLTSRSRS